MQSHDDNTTNKNNEMVDDEEAILNQLQAMDEGNVGDHQADVDEQQQSVGGDETVEVEDDLSQDFFKHSSFDFDAQKYTMSTAVDEVYAMLPLHYPQYAFPSIDPLKKMFIQLKVMTLQQLMQMRFEKSSELNDKLCSLRFIYNHDEHQNMANDIGSNGQPLCIAINANEFRQRKMASVDFLLFELTQLILVRPVITAADMKKHLSKRDRLLSLGCPKLDRLLNGGIPTKCITELWGESGSGKTQICMQLLAMAVCPSCIGGLSGSALYLFSETKFPATRLTDFLEDRWTTMQMEKTIQEKQGEVDADLQSISSVDDLADRVLSMKLESIEHLISVIDNNVQRACEMREKSNQIKLIIIDSVAALFRTEKATTRSIQLGDIANKLRQYADRFNLSVFIVNQVSDDFKSDIPIYQSPDHKQNQHEKIESQQAYEAVLYSAPDLVEGNDEQDESLRRYRRQFFMNTLSNKARKKPALGLAWSCYVNISLMCSKNERPTTTTFRKASPMKRPRLSSGVTQLSTSDNREASETDIQTTEEVVLRQLHVVFAPHLKNGTQSFYIEKGGIRGIDLDK